jgi:hypothetical protein
VKKTFILVSAAAVLVIVAITTFVLFSKLDSLISAAIERSGSHVTGTNVSVASVEIGIVGGPGGGQPAELGKTIITALARKAAEAVARDKAGNVVETTLKDALGKKTKDLINSVR